VEDAAQEHASRARGAGDRAPGAERLVALRPVPEEHGDDRERGGGDDRPAEALRRAGGDQLALVGGEPGGERSDRHDQEPGHEDAPPPEQVRRAAAQQQEAAERDRVGVDDPGEVRLGEVEPLADARQGDVDDRRVKDDDEHGQAEQDQRGPSAVEVFLIGRHFT
jgi:hypothetical protein